MPVGTPWGIAIVESNVIVGVTGRYRFKALATRRLRELEHQLDLTSEPPRRYKLVRRSGSDSVDWGARPATAESGSGPGSDEAEPARRPTSPTGERRA